MSYELYTVEFPENPQAVCFVNGIIANNGKGKLWMWKNLFKIRRTIGAADGCFMAKGGICSSNEIMFSSWWDNEAALMNLMKSPAHREWMRYIIDHPDELTLYNEMYHCGRPGKYSKSPRGMALHYPSKRIK